jgi:hypothetical protein
MLKILALLLISVSVKAQSVYKTPAGAKYHTATCHMVKMFQSRLRLTRQKN